MLENLEVVVLEEHKLNQVEGILPGVGHGQRNGGGALNWVSKDPTTDRRQCYRPEARALSDLENRMVYTVEQQRFVVSPAAPHWTDRMNHSDLGQQACTGEKRSTCRYQPSVLVILTPLHDDRIAIFLRSWIVEHVRNADMLTLSGSVDQSSQSAAMTEEGVGWVDDHIHAALQ